MGYSPRGHKEADTTERHTQLFNSVVFVSADQQQESAIYVYMCPLFFGFPSRSGPHRAVSRVIRDCEFKYKIQVGF